MDISTGLLAIVGTVVGFLLKNTYDSVIKKPEEVTYAREKK
jgi:hypothetical protein